MSLVLAAVVLFALALPHRVTLDRATPRAAIAVWTAALTLRALVGLLVVLVSVFFLPGTGLFQAVTRWCWHAVLPLLTTHVQVSGHAIGDTATVIPGFAVLLALLSVIWGLIRAAHAVRTMVRGAVGDGPLESTIVGGPDVAVAGLTRPRIVISAGALLTLNDAELSAGIEHERGHITGHHRFILIFGHVCRALGFLVPRSGAAARELAFHLERDADQYALRRTREPVALAAKAARARSSTPTLMSLAGETSATKRVGLLTRARRTSLQRHGPRYLAATLALLALTVVATIPPLALAGATAISTTPAGEHCAS